MGSILRDMGSFRIDVIAFYLSNEIDQRLHFPLNHVQRRTSCDLAVSTVGGGFCPRHRSYRRRRNSCCVRYGWLKLAMSLKECQRR